MDLKKIHCFLANNFFTWRNPKWILIRSFPPLFKLILLLMAFLQLQISSNNKKSPPDGACSISFFKSKVQIFPYMKGNLLKEKVFSSSENYLWDFECRFSFPKDPNCMESLNGERRLYHSDMDKVVKLGSFPLTSQSLYPHLELRYKATVFLKQATHFQY